MFCGEYFDDVCVAFGVRGLIWAYDHKKPFQILKYNLFLFTILVTVSCNFFFVYHQRLVSNKNIFVIFSNGLNTSQEASKVKISSRGFRLTNEIIELLAKKKIIEIEIQISYRSDLFYFI